MGDDSSRAEWGSRQSRKIANGPTTREINDFLDKGSRQSRKAFLLRRRGGTMETGRWRR